MYDAMTTQSRLLDAAEACVRSRGFDGFSYADLARQVGIRKASIHHYFPAKSDLALALVRRYCERVSQAIAEADSALPCAADRLSAYLQFARQAVGEGNQLCLCVAMCLGWEGLSDPVREQLSDYNQSLATWLAAVFRAGKADQSIREVEAPDEEAMNCLALVNGAMLLTRSARDGTLFDQSVAQLVRRLKLSELPGY